MDLVHEVRQPQSDVRKDDQEEDPDNLQRNERDDAPRITSYNVCYTKLLRMSGNVASRPIPSSPRPGLQADPRDRMLLYSKVETGASAPVFISCLSWRDRPRITSYNVCYTKLLRGRPACIRTKSLLLSL